MPERPSNPRIRHADGSITPVELAYRGVDDEGMHLWTCMTPLNPATDTFEVDTLPGRTSIGFRVRRDSVTCPDCHMTSHHPEDVRQGYCGNCHAFTSPPYGARL